MKTMRVLMVEDSEADVEWIRRAFAASTSVVIEADRAAALNDALEALQKSAYDIVLLDLGLPDSTALHTVLRVRAQQPDIPIVILSGNDDERFALDAVVAGAQDYLVKTPETRKSLVRTMRFAVARSQALKSLRSGLLRDPLTHFFTHAGFSAVVDCYLGSVDYAHEHPMLLYLELTPATVPKHPDDTFDMDATMLDASAVIAGAFNGNDSYAVLENGRFAVLVRNADRLSEEHILQRLHKAVREHNQKPRSRALEFKTGIVPCSESPMRQVEDLLDRAEQNAAHSNS